MLKTRNGFNSEQEYRAYTKTSDFLLNYSWKGKTKEQIIHEMALPDYEQNYLEEAMEQLTKKDDFSGMALDNFILRRLDEDEEEEEIDPDEVVFIESEEC